MRRRRLLFLIPPAAFLAAAICFLARPPVVLVAGEAFTALYGKPRAFLAGASASLRLFRRVRSVAVAEEADTDLAVIAVEEAGAAPFCAVFPYRYREAAARYSEKHPAVPVLLLGGRLRERPALPPGVLFVRTDAEADMFAAGKEAASLAGERGVLVIEDGWAGERERAAFREGLAAGGFAGQPVYAAGEGFFYAGYGCVVIAGPAEPFLNQNLDTPLIIFSWINPAWSPPEAQVIFDDSPWALLVRAVRAVPAGGSLAFPSTVWKNKKNFLILTRG